MEHGMLYYSKENSGGNKVLFSLSNTVACSCSACHTHVYVSWHTHLTPHILFFTGVPGDSDGIHPTPPGGPVFFFSPDFFSPLIVICA